MAVLVEAISVVVRRDAIDRAYKGGWAAFVRNVPNATLCTDEELARIGFMSPPDTERYLDHLISHGLAFLREGKAMDLVVVDQQQGPTSPCDWVEFAKLPFTPGGPEARISACWIFEGPRMAVGIHLSGREFLLATPPGWEYENSLSHRFTFIPTPDLPRRLEFLREEGGVRVYLDLDTRKELYLGGTHRKPE